MKQWNKFLIACFALLIFAGVAQTEVEAADYTFNDSHYVGIWSPDSDAPKELQYWGIHPIIRTADKEVKVVKITQSKKILKNIETKKQYDGDISLSFVPKKSEIKIMPVNSRKVSFVMYQNQKKIKKDIR